MADDLDLRMIQLELAQLRKEMERLDKQKFPKGRYQMILFSVLYALLVPMIVHFWAPDLGLTGYNSGRFSSVDVKGAVDAERIRFEDNSRKGVETHGHITPDRPYISLRSSEGEAIDIDANRILLEGKRGELIIELNEKGEPVLRSVPKVDKK